MPDFAELPGEEILAVAPRRRDDPNDAPPGAAVAAFDLDGTLLRGDSFRSFMQVMLFRGWLRSLATVMVSPVLAPLFFIPPTRGLSVVGYVWLAAVGVSPRRLAELTEEFAAAYASTDMGHQITETLKRLREHVDAGDRVVIVTGSPDPVASALCAALGLDGVPVIAARLTPGPGGLLRYESCMGETKLARLREAGFTPPFGHAYTDSHTDLPLLRAADRRYVIAPRRRALRRIRRHLPDVVVIP